MEVEDADSPEGVDTSTVMEIDEDQSQPSPNQWACCRRKNITTTEGLILTDEGYVAHTITMPLYTTTT